MNHLQLHDHLSEVFLDLKSKKIKPKEAKELFNGAGKILSNCKNELQAMHMGFKLDCPLLEIKKKDIKTTK